MTITAGQVRAARGLIDWSRHRLAEAAAVEPATIAAFEEEGIVPDETTVTALRQALEAAGVDFLDGGSAGVRLRPSADSMRPDELNAENDG